MTKIHLPKKRDSDAYHGPATLPPAECVTHSSTDVLQRVPGRKGLEGILYSSNWSLTLTSKTGAGIAALPIFTGKDDLFPFSVL